jgi:hypothetical protein
MKLVKVKEWDYRELKNWMALKYQSVKNSMPIVNPLITSSILIWVWIRISKRIRKESK